ncbi:hypothetical protein NEAUS06_0312 [Nematocida ausubeli]|nr:hypothetical protein NEAUS06_0312 [Nematocida ausubeli]
MAYPIGGGIYSDYWGKIQFKMNQDGGLIDSSGYFTGVPVESKDEIISTGILSDIGFYQARDLSKDVMSQNYISAKMLIEDISNTTKKDIQELHDEKFSGDFLSGVMKYFKSGRGQPGKEKSCMTVCICSDPTCSKKCKSIKCIEPMYLL